MPWHCDRLSSGPTADGLRDNGTLHSWRDNCRDEVRDDLTDEKLEPAEFDKLLRAWADTFDGAVSATNARHHARTIVNGFNPVTAGDVDDTIVVAHEQLLVMTTLFRSIGRLTDDKDTRALCKHGADQAECVANDIDILRERAAKAGLVGGAA